MDEWFFYSPSKPDPDIVGVCWGWEATGACRRRDHRRHHRRRGGHYRHPPRRRIHRRRTPPPHPPRRLVLSDATRRGRGSLPAF